jgi:uncharacterized BrkB/YihY/UPF0761 family membrane protein
MPRFGRLTPRDHEKAAAYAQWFGQRQPLAIASFVLGLFSLIEFGALLVFGIAGTILGAMALSRLKVDIDRPRGHWLAWCGIVTSVVSLLIAIKFVYRWV